VTAKMSQES
jgi:hypothetical protein